MKPEELKPLLEGLISDWEGEVVEFKQAGNDFDTDKIGRYFSARWWARLTARRRSG